ncbi:MAG: site-specific DNA-methyltransferase, partial [Alphaproteobacteria bacterium]|nr:site-specific DNA-methyltransferase [Alphaproteobacteria bacterium]
SDIKLSHRVEQTDCITMLNQLPPNSVQCIFADPPFNLDKKYNSYKDRLSVDDYFSWTEEWIKASMRVLRDDGSIFIYNIPKMLIKTAPLLEKYAHFRHWISWNSPGRPLGKTLQPAHYGILYYTKQAKGFKFYDIRAPHKKCRICKAYHKDYGGKSHLRHSFGYTVGDVWDDIHRVRHAGKRIENHPCQLPVHLIERIILMSTDANDVFVDLFAGGGAGGVAAKQLGRGYLGADIDEKYVDLANEKIEETQLRKFNNHFVSIHLNKPISVRDIDIKNGLFDG